MSGFVVSKPEQSHHRLFDFAKTAIINIFAHPYATVCELYCGGAPETDKWEAAPIGHYIGIGINILLLTYSVLYQYGFIED
jgi:mRNA (guanine-N7-)-methyltransferase